MLGSKQSSTFLRSQVLRHDQMSKIHYHLPVRKAIYSLNLWSSWSKALAKTTTSVSTRIHVIQHMQHSTTICFSMWEWDQASQILLEVAENTSVTNDDCSFFLEILMLLMKSARYTNSSCLFESFLQHSDPIWRTFLVSSTHLWTRSPFLA